LRVSVRVGSFRNILPQKVPQLRREKGVRSLAHEHEAALEQLRLAR
jgi:hypothetical protein